MEGDLSNPNRSIGTRKGVYLPATGNDNCMGQNLCWL